MAEKNESESQDFLQPWKLSDVVLVVEEERLHVHRAVLAMWSPVFEKMFTSEFQEKDKNEVPLPDKKSSEVQELLLMIYSSVADREAKQITEENCYFLVKLAHEYQMGAIVQKCEDFIVEKVKTKSKYGALAELVFAQTYKLEKVRRASVDQAHNLSLQELKNNEMYDEIQMENLKEIMEGIIMRLQRELNESLLTSQQRQGKINAVLRKNGSVRSAALKNVDETVRFLVSHASQKQNYSYIGCSDTDSYLSALSQDKYGKTANCDGLSRASVYLRAIKTSLESLQIY